MRFSNECKGIFAMLVLSIIYGIAGITARTLQVHFGTWQQLATQSWLAFVMLKGVQVVTANGRPSQPLMLSEFKSLFGRALIGRVASSYLFIQACLFAPLGNVGWISALPTSALFGWLLFGQNVSRREWLLLLVGILGVGLIVGPDMSIWKMSGRGELYALLSTFASGLAALIGRTVTRERGSIFATSWIVLFTAVLATIAAFIFEGGLIVPPMVSIPVLILVSMMVGVGTLCSLYGYTYLCASTATGILSLEAVWAVMLGMLIYGEQPTVLSLIGGVAIVIAAYLIAPSTRKEAASGECFQPKQPITAPPICGEIINQQLIM